MHLQIVSHISLLTWKFRILLSLIKWWGILEYTDHFQIQQNTKTLITEHRFIYFGFFYYQGTRHLNQLVNVSYGVFQGAG